MDPSPSATPPQSGIWQQKKSLRILVYVLAAVSVTIAIVFTVGLVLWNNRPEKVLLDALDYSLQRPGMYHAVLGTNDVRVWNDGRLYSADATISGVPLQAISSANMLYVKSSEPQKMLDMALAGKSLGVAQPYVGKVADSFKDKWISLDLQSKSLQSSSIDSVQCMIDVKDTLSGNETASREFAGAYAQHPFLIIKTASETDKTTIYDLSVDSNKQKLFLDEMRKNRFKTTLQSCQDVDFSLPQKNPVTVTVEITRPIHKLKKMTIKGVSAKDVVITADYGAVPAIVTPKESVDINQVTNQVFTSVMQSYLQGR